MTEAVPLYTLQTYTPPTMVGLLRKAMIGAALLIAALAFLFPLVTGSDDIFITIVFLGVAALDLLIAAFLPAMLGRMAGPLRYALYRDRLEIVQGDPAGGGRTIAVLPYSAVSRTEEAEGLPDKDTAAGFCALRIFLQHDLPALARFPHYDRNGGPVLTLRGLRSEDSPLPRLKELVEKSGAA